MVMVMALFYLLPFPCKDSCEAYVTAVIALSDTFYSTLSMALHLEFIV